MVLRVSSEEPIKWNKRKVAKWSGRFISTMLALIAILLVYVGLSSRLHEGIPQVFGREMYVILSGSMEPELPTGSVILDETNVNVKELKTGDIITFRVPTAGAELNNNGEMLITHRIKQVVMNNGTIGFKTKGDNNAAEDTWVVRPNDVVAKYDNITIPYVGYIINFLKTKIGIACVMIAFGIYTLVITILKSKEGMTMKNYKDPNPAYSHSAHE